MFEGISVFEKICFTYKLHTNVYIRGLHTNVYTNSGLLFVSLNFQPFI